MNRVGSANFGGPSILKKNYTSDPKDASFGLNQALMHDLDARFDNQDRMINYLIQQLSSFEQTINNSNRRVSDLQERDRDSLIKVKNDLKYQNELSIRDLNDVLTRLKVLEDSTKNDDSLRSELRAKLKLAEEQNLEMANFIRSL
jgi:hypothetical protein